MINIKNSINDVIVQKHLKKLTTVEKKKNSDEEKKNLFNAIEKLKSNLKGSSPKLDNDFENFLDFLITSIKNKELYHNLITLEPKRLDIFKSAIEKKYGNLLNSIYKTIKNKNKTKNITYRTLLLEGFYYDDYDRWDAYDLAKSLNINVCPYCNRIPTYTIGTSNEKGVRPQFDHFFDKASYPYLSMSIYNLVPSCSICNSSFKGSKDFNLIDYYHPYQRGFDCNNIKFTLQIKDIDDFLSTMSAKLDIPEYEIAFITSSNITIPKNIKDFGLTELYNYDKNYTNELIKKSFIYDNTYIENLYSDYEGTLFNSKEEIKNLVIGNYLNITDINNRPLGKLTKDIVEELGVF